MLKLMLPAYFTALGTQSSAATIPVTIAQVKKIGVRDEIANFAVPLCATIHLSGSMLKIVCCCLALMLIQVIEIDFVQFLGFMMMLELRWLQRLAFLVERLWQRLELLLRC